MRIVLISPHFPEYSLRFGRALGKVAEVTTIIDNVQYDREIGIDVDELTSGQQVIFSKFKTLQDLVQIVRVLRDVRPDVIHFQEAVGLRRAFFNRLLPLAVANHPQIALTVHDPLPHEGADEWKGKQSRFLAHGLRRRANVVFAHGDFCARALERGGEVRSPVVRIDHGEILTGNVAPVSGAPIPTFLMFGRMEKYKGLTVLLEAAKIVASASASVKIRICGRGAELDRFGSEFESLKIVSVENRFLSAAELKRELLSCDCVLLPYTSATQSGVASAAFSNARCVVASRCGGLVDIVEDGYNGLMVAPGKPDELAAAILRVSQETNLRERLNAGAEETKRQRLDWDRIAAVVMRGYAAGTKK